MTCPYGTRHDSGRLGCDNKTGIVKPAADPAVSRFADGGAGTGAQAPVPFYLPAVEVWACRALWCAVLIEHWNLAVAPGKAEQPYAVDYAQRWFGSADFHEVCDMAGVGGEDVLRAYRKARVKGAGFRLTVQKQASRNAGGMS